MANVRRNDGGARVNRFGGRVAEIGIRRDRRALRGVTESSRISYWRWQGRGPALGGNLRHPTGMPVECVIADTTIGGVAEAAACADKFSREGVDVTLTVTPCWCYGTETMDMDPLTIKAVWGFNGTERPGAVYLAAVLAAHNQKGLPAFGIYGHDVQNADESDRIPEDVPRRFSGVFARAGLAARLMRGQEYLARVGLDGSRFDRGPRISSSYLACATSTST